MSFFNYLPMIQENILYKTRLHLILFLLKVARGAFFLLFLWLIGGYFYGTAFLFVTPISILLYIWFYFQVFWMESYFYISNKRIWLRIKNGFFSKFEMNLYFTQIKDMAYSKNNILHYYFNYGTFFARSSGSEDDSGFMVKHIPNVEKVYMIVSYLYSISQEAREKIHNLDALEQRSKKNRNELIEKEKRVLLGITGIKEVFELSKEDKKFIFENEEDRNHGVYECIKRDVTLCATHDDTFRDPDAPIVFKSGTKVIFPAVSFHEVDEKNTVSSSPGATVHNHLIQHLKNFHKDDATLLIGFDV